MTLLFAPWVVRFQPTGDFSPKTPGEFLAKIPVYSGQHGEIGYFRTKTQGNKLLGSFLADDPEQLKAALNALPNIKVTGVEKLTQEQLVAYEKLPQESLIEASSRPLILGITTSVITRSMRSSFPLNKLSASTPSDASRTV